MTRPDALRMPSRGLWLALAALILAGCAGAIAPTTEQFASAVRASEVALAGAAAAQRRAGAYAARGDWPAAVRQVDEIMFSLRDARRVRRRVAGAYERALAEQRAAADSLAPDQLASAAGVAPRRPPSGREATDAKALPAAAIQTADALVTETQAALAVVTRNVARIERVAAEARRLARLPLVDVTVPPLPVETPKLVPPPDTGFDQEVTVPPLPVETPKLVPPPDTGFGRAPSSRGR